jgi:hypothetical protein
MNRMAIEHPRPGLSPPAAKEWREKDNPLRLDVRIGSMGLNVRNPGAHDASRIRRDREGPCGRTRCGAVMADRRSRRIRVPAYRRIAFAMVCSCMFDVPS